MRLFMTSSSSGGGGHGPFCRSIGHEAVCSKTDSLVVRGLARHRVFRISILGTRNRCFPFFGFRGQSLQEITFFIRQRKSFPDFGFDRRETCFFFCEGNFRVIDCFDEHLWRLLGSSIRFLQLSAPYALRCWSGPGC